MNIRLTQLDGALPNLALMRISHWHKQRGDTVHFTRMSRRELYEPEYERVYGSAIFDFTADKIERFMASFPDAILGGTGTEPKDKPPTVTVEKVIGDHPYVDYDHWPSFTASMGFTQRGCRLACKFCVVPMKEGKPRHAGTIREIWRGPSYPKNLHLLDNDFFGGPQWQDRIAEIREGGFKVSFTQGINVRAVTPEVAAAVATVEYRNNKFNRRTLYTAWDNLKDEEVFFRGVDTLEAAGVPARHLMAYMLIGFDKKETWERIHHRFNRMVARGIRPYPMPFDHRRRDLKKFQRWACTGLYRAIPFDKYDSGIKRRPPSEPPQPDMFQ